MRIASYFEVVMDTKAQRRRGPELDEAILQAVWDELSTKGYGGLTLDSVASRAGTSRPVLHRRWKSRSELVMAALARYVALNPISIPTKEASGARWCCCSSGFQRELSLI